MTINHQTDVPAHVRANIVLPYDYLRSFQSFEHPPSALDGLREVGTGGAAVFQAGAVHRIRAEAGDAGFEKGKVGRKGHGA